MKYKFYFLLLVLLFNSSCNNEGTSVSYVFRECTDLASIVTSDTSLATTAAGTKWLYRLQFTESNRSTSVTAMKNSGDFDFIVMDYSYDGSGDDEFTAENIASIKGGTPAKQVIAYLSIGEAENYRYYFDNNWTNGANGQPVRSAPCWLNRTNPDWLGNYKVQYWSEEWQQIILAYLDKIISVGFDGVYLDIIDGFEYWADSSNGEGYILTEAEAAARMINLVKRIAYHARITNGLTDFLVFPQNGERILDYDTGIGGLSSNDFLNSISGIGVEDLFYDETSAVNQEEIDERTAYLDSINAAGKKVFVVDYVDDGSHSNIEISLFRSTASGVPYSYLPYAAISDRELDEINVFSGQGAP